MRASKPLVDRMDISVGPIRIEILEPLRKLRVVVEAPLPHDFEELMSAAALKVSTLK